MAKKPFKVSARTARLIGRENVSNAEGALTELVKNCYDADSPICILYFNIEYEAVPNSLSQEKYLELVKETEVKIENSRKPSFFEDAYHLNKENGSYIMKEDLSSKLATEIESYFKSKNSLFIIDSGEGMTEEIIDKHWMTIGTNNKLTDVFTKSGRIKAGAKGIGRFALDRLGAECYMVTLSKDFKDGYSWSVNWEDFEQEGAVIGEVSADFNIKPDLNFKNEIRTLTQSKKVEEIFEKHYEWFAQGTLLYIKELRDWWSNSDLEKLFKSLQTISPPVNYKKFNIYLLSEFYPNAFGRVDNDEYTDYDYKIYAKIFIDKSIKINIYRNEFQINKIDKDFFNRTLMKATPYDFETFKKGNYIIETSIDELLPGLAKSDIASEVEQLKEFDFTFYFIKMLANEQDKSRFYYRSFNRSDRVDWFKKFGGIKIYRDNFRVRPYGEADNTSFDWLLLGDRQAKSPAGITKKGAGWRVAPNQVAGVVNISRLANLSFEDKSSREGLQENNTFSILKQLLLAIINQFEYDRHIVMREMDALFREKREEEAAKLKAEELLQEEENKKEQQSEDDKTSSEYKEERDTFKTAYTSIKADLEDAEEEIRILSALATSGIIVTSFAHEFASFRLILIRNTNYLYNRYYQENLF